MASFKESEKDGKFGESIFLKMYDEIYKKDGWELYDMRDDRWFQFLDIDFLLLKKGYTVDDYLDWHVFRSGNPDVIKERREWAKAVEVKTDKRTNETRNIVYELISHNMPGCMARSYADFILYVCTDNIPNPSSYKEVFYFDLYALRECLIKHIKDKHLKNEKFLNVCYLNAMEYIEGVKEDILNLLIDVDYIIECGDICHNITETIDKIYGTAC
jgi:hypothetical protein